jgi:hypothetical protein
MAQESLVWTISQKAKELDDCVKNLTITFPKQEELSDLAHFLQVSSMTVLCDTGTARGFPGHGLSVLLLCKAYGATHQLQKLLSLAKSLHIVDPAMMSNAEALCTEISKTLDVFILSSTTRTSS